MHKPKWGIFYDFHTMPACPDVGRKFDFDAITDRIKECGVDFIVFPARCNLGVAYYDTKIGIRHPSLKYDLLGKFSAACVKKGIALSAYFNVGLSHEEGLRHRDWTIVTPEGYAYQPPHLSHWFRKMCYNSPYGEHLAEMVKEVVKGYPVAGLFLDCMGAWPCLGVECIREMKSLGVDWQNPDELREFAHRSQVSMAEKLSKTVKKITKDLLIYFNGVAFEDQSDTGTYLEYECLPTGGWGYDVLPVYSRYARNLGKHVLNMTGRFHESWGDFGGIRTQAGLEYDCLYGLANCMGTTIGDHFHPRGDINHEVYDLIKRIYGKLQKLEPWLENAVPVTDLALIGSSDAFFPYKEESAAKGNYSVQGGARMLCELKRQFDVLSPNLDFSGYDLIILSDFVTMDKQMTAKIKSHLAKGGKIISSAWSGLDADRKDFVLREWGLKFKGDSPYDPAYLSVSRGIADNFPNMPVTLYEKGTEMERSGKTEVLAKIIAPYYNRHWDGEHAFLYTPPDKNTGKPAITRNGNIVHFSHPLFLGYYKTAQVPMRTLLDNVLKIMLPNPVVKTEGLPSFARVTVTKQDKQKRRMVHVLCYVPEHRGEKIEMIEEPIEVRDVRIMLRTDNRKPKKVYLAPDKKELQFTVEDPYITVTVPKIKGHALIVFE